MQVFFDDQIFHKQCRGGISRYYTDLALGLAKREGIRVVVFGGWHKNVFLKELTASQHLKILQRPRSASLRINRWAQRLSKVWRRLAFLQAIKQDPETIYHPTYFQVDDFLQRHAKGTVVTFYDMMAEVFLKERQVRHRSDKKNAALKTDAIIAISDSTRRDLQHFYPGIKTPIAVTHLTSNLGTLEDKVLPDFFLSASSYFLMIGPRAGYKNGLVALQAFGLLAKNRPNIHLVLCSQADLTAEEEGVLARAGIREQVHAIDADDTLLVRLLRGAIALIYPSRYEGFGLPVLEAMQQGCPVVTTRLTSLPEVVGEAGIYVDADSVEGMAATMEQLLTHPPKAQDSIKKGYEQAQKFTLANMVDGTLEVYEQVLTRTANGGQ